MSEPFTVKWVYKVDGILRERVIEASQINVAYDDRPPSQEPATTDGPMLGIYSVDRTGIVVIGNPGEGSESMALTFGTVYVMNKEGHTVATYRLADPEGLRNVVGSATAFEPESLQKLKQRAGG